MLPLSSSFDSDAASNESFSCVIDCSRPRGPANAFDYHTEGSDSDDGDFDLEFAHVQRRAIEDLFEQTDAAMYGEPCTGGGAHVAEAREWLQLGYMRVRGRAVQQPAPPGEAAGERRDRGKCPVRSAQHCVLSTALSANATGLYVRGERCKVLPPPAQCQDATLLGDAGPAAVDVPSASAAPSPVDEVFASHGVLQECIAVHVGPVSQRARAEERKRSRLGLPPHAPMEAIAFHVIGELAARCWRALLPHLVAIPVLTAQALSRTLAKFGRLHAASSQPAEEEALLLSKGGEGRYATDPTTSERSHAQPGMQATERRRLLAAPNARGGRGGLAAGGCRGMVGARPRVIEPDTTCPTSHQYAPALCGGSSTVSAHAGIHGNGRFPPSAASSARHAPTAVRARVPSAPSANTRSAGRQLMFAPQDHPGEPEALCQQQGRLARMAPPQRAASVGQKPRAASAHRPPDAGEPARRPMTGLLPRAPCPKRGVSASAKSRTASSANRQPTWQPQLPGTTITSALGAIRLPNIACRGQSCRGRSSSGERGRGVTITVDRELGENRAL